MMRNLQCRNYVFRQSIDQTWLPSSIQLVHTRRGWMQYSGGASRLNDLVADVKGHDTRLQCGEREFCCLLLMASRNDTIKQHVRCSIAISITTRDQLLLLRVRRLKLECNTRATWQCLKAVDCVLAGRSNRRDRYGAD